VRVTKFGRTLAHHKPSCELLVGGAGDEIYWLDLAEGRFKAPLVCPVGEPHARAHRGGVRERQSGLLRRST